MNSSTFLMAGSGNRYPDCFALSSAVSGSNYYGSASRLAVDALGNIGVVAGFNSGVNGVRAAKWTSAGALLFDRRIYQTNEDVRIDGSQGDITFDAAGNMYTMAWEYPSNMNVTKFDAAGTMLMRFAMSVNSVPYMKKLAVDSAGCCYLAGRFATYKAGLVKINETGSSVMWQIGFDYSYNGSSNDANQDCFNDLAFSAAEDYLYFCGETTDASATTYPFVGRVLTSTGAYTIYRLGVLGRAVGICRVVNDYYVATSAGTLYKFDSALNLLWSKSYGGLAFENMATDGYGNLYMAYGSMQFVKIEAATGIPQFSGKFSGPAGTTTAVWDELSFNAEGSIHCAMANTSTTAGVGALFIAKVPSDGFGAGTYGPITYAVSAAPLMSVIGNPTRNAFAPPLESVGASLRTTTVYPYAHTTTQTVYPIQT